ncbi:hypothetical protein GLOTRDRAFT_77319 [Gloeophyllum trabeum ATCC 11539]|uniref:DUF202 domain-containing protein n=1 Tax=Gloeophyllum trabeum (strain ATCC 11539 / FP-39264 / Madison 617) TaxID=670483 RepID=S7Q3T5_GLOTA|nr:uncharacterized protein GLOTRDRAFT_77319 [Gloeophyllum trabeum ATCC 11539]EPQ54666.1 hypothetical protein GLOTRDRAFT_77319 [Gloeophyllum trabeum ATCC 11539]
MAPTPPPSPEQGQGPPPSAGEGTNATLSEAPLPFPSESRGSDTPTTRAGSTKSLHRREKPSALTRLRGARHNPNLTLVNSGSVARDHLANERTVLAYVRTSLALSSMGVGILKRRYSRCFATDALASAALVQLFTLSNSSGESNKTIHIYARPLGAAGVALGLVTLFIGVVRYFTVQIALTEGKYPVARITVLFVGAVLTALICVVFGILVAARS